MQIKKYFSFYVIQKHSHLCKRELVSSHKTITILIRHVISLYVQSHTKNLRNIKKVP